eukprot:jgi/Undpi1/951/HiC_scaffold_10.g04415.m1
MGALNDGVTERCGRVRGVIHEMWVVDHQEHPGVKDLEIVGGRGLQGASTPPGYGSPRDSRGAAASNDERNDKSCRAVAAQLAGGFPKAERKQALTIDADCVIALPGGLGTWDELWEIVCLKGLGLCDLPVCVLDVDDFYAGFRTQLKRAQDDRLLYADVDKLAHFETDPEAAMKWCESQLKKANGKLKKKEERNAPISRKGTIPAKPSWTLTDRLVLVGSVIALSAVISLASAKCYR